MGERITDDLVVNAFCAAIMKRNPSVPLIFHSDRGSQYAGYRFRSLLSRYNITQSMSGKGNCYDNAYAESFFSTLKTELGYRYESRSVARHRTYLNTLRHFTTESGGTRHWIMYLLWNTRGNIW